MDMTTSNQRQQRINFTLGWDPGTVRGDAPQGHQGRHRHIEQAARRGAVGHGALEQRRRFLADHGAAAVIQFVNIAGRNRPGKLLLQAVYFSGCGRQCLPGSVPVGRQTHIGIHGKNVLPLRLLGLAAGGEAAEQQRRKGRAHPFFHSSRRPSRARMSVASSANSRCPPTGMP